MSIITADTHTHTMGKPPRHVLSLLLLLVGCALQRLLLMGRRHDALNVALAGQLWGPALVLAHGYGETAAAVQGPWKQGISTSKVPESCAAAANLPL